MIDAFHLPALVHPPTANWMFGRGECTAELRLPRLSPALLGVQVQALLEARERGLAGRPVREIVGVIDRVAERLLDRGDPLRRTADRALPAVTGYSPGMIQRVLDTMAAEWRAPRLLELLQAEFGDPELLDRFGPRPPAPGRTRAFGPRLATHVFSGNVPGVAVTSLIRSLLVKAATLGKTATGEPLLPALFARGVAEEDPDLGACVAVTRWPGSDETLERVALERSDAVVVYGGSEAVAAVRARTPPAARFIGYGHRLSFGMVAREALGEGARESARQAALDVATFDQQGCVSPHLFYVEEGGTTSPRAWAALLAREMEALESLLPRGALSPGEASAIRQLRGEAEFAQLMDPEGPELHASREGTTWTVLWDPDPAFLPSCLNRTVRVKPAADLHAVPGAVAPLGPLLQTVGIAAGAERLQRLAGELGALGASRVSPLGRMAWPPGSWHHDGRAPLGELVRWCDLEE
ncbi:MAG: acyl-CoA reductase [Gemmatimonadota bacterium]|nr:acyl-CoA reductase [Gemmatimonadota bacterium]